MNVSLTAELDAFVLGLVESGRYGSSSEVVREGLRMLMDREELRRVEVEEFRRQVQIGLDDLEAGRSIRMTPSQVAEMVKAYGRDEVRKKDLKGA